MRFNPVATATTESLPTNAFLALAIMREDGQPWQNTHDLPVMGRLLARGTEPTNWLIRTESGVYFCLKGTAVEPSPETSMDRKLIVACKDSLGRGHLNAAGVLAGATNLLTFNHATKGRHLVGFTRCEHGYVYSEKPDSAKADGEQSFCVEIAPTGEHIAGFLRQEGALCTKCPVS